MTGSKQQKQEDVAGLSKNAVFIKQGSLDIMSEGALSHITWHSFSKPQLQP
jgi:hypothetical protein